MLELDSLFRCGLEHTTGLLSVTLGLSATIARDRADVRRNWIRSREDANGRSSLRGWY